MNKAKILLVEDESGLREVIAEFLRSNGDYEIFTAVDGVSGIRAFKNHVPEIVITDLNMPGMRGEELARHVKKSGTHTKVICMSGDPQLEPVAKAAGCDVFLKKPFHLLTLREAVEKLLKMACVEVLTCR